MFKPSSAGDCIQNTIALHMFLHMHHGLKKVVLAVIFMFLLAKLPTYNIPISTVF